MSFTPHSELRPREDRWRPPAGWTHSAIRQLKEAGLEIGTKTVKVAVAVGAVAIAVVVKLKFGDDHDA